MASDQLSIIRDFSKLLRILRNIAAIALPRCDVLCVFGVASVLGFQGLLLGSSNELQAFEVRPLVHNLAPSGRKATTSLTISNPSDQLLTVEIGIDRRVFGTDVDQALLPADDDFLIFPPTAFIPPGASQVVRLQWLGDPALSASQSYYAHVAQVPVETVAQRSAESIAGPDRELRFVLAFNVAVHVSPEGAIPEVRVVETALELAESGEAILRAILANDGNRHTYASEMAMTVVSAGASVTIEPDAILAMKLDTFLPPGISRTLRIPLGEGNWTEPLELNLLLRSAG